MSAQHIFDAAPLGALIRYADGQPKPPARFNRKLAAWEHSNGVGRLIGKRPAVDRGSYAFPDGFALHRGDFASGGVIIMVVTMMVDVTSALHFEIIDLPNPGMVRVLTRANGEDELRYLAPDMATAQAWARDNRYSNMVFDVVGADDVGAPSHAIGRAA